MNKKLNLLSLFLCLGLFLLSSPSHAATSPDAIAVRVMPNVEHVSPLVWYYDNVDIKGAPQSLIVDGYEAVRDGRTVYVNAGNVVTNVLGTERLYTNIYIISYNQEAENDTRDIFGQLLQYWKFNAELVTRTGPGLCQPKSEDSCDVAIGCTGKLVDLSCEDVGGGKFACVKKCILSSECDYGQYCDSAKAKLIRDVKRLADMGEIQRVIEQYKVKNSKYPALPSGSYLPNKTISVWPSWNENLGKSLAYRLPQDPVNKLQNCPTGFDSVTCWNEATKKYATDFKNPVFPEGSLAFAYSLDIKSDVYMLCANFETDYDGIPSDIVCKSNFVKPPAVGQVEVVFGNLNSKEGAFKSSFAVNSTYPIKWDTLSIEGIPNWADWSSRGWTWASGSTGLKKVDIPNFDNQKNLVADKVDLVGGNTYGYFELKVSVEDIYGNAGSAQGTVTICNAVTCADKGAECGVLKDGCGRNLLCGNCDDPNLPDCVANKCIKQ